MRTRPYALLLTYSWLFLFCLTPLCLVLMTSFLSRDPIDMAGLPFTLKPFLSLISPLYFQAFYRSFQLALLTTLICLLLAYPFSYLLSKSRHPSLLILLIMIPFWTSSLIRTYALIAILKTQGLLNALLLKCHLISKPLEMLYTNYAVVLGLIYNLFPFMVLPLLSQMQRFDLKLLDAAKDLGASRLQIFLRVYLPLTKQGIFAGTMMVFLPAMTLFYIPTILGGARSMLLGNIIQDQFMLLEDWPQGAATSVVLTLILLCLVTFNRSKKRSSLNEIQDL